MKSIGNNIFTRDSCEDCKPIDFMKENDQKLERLSEMSVHLTSLDLSLFICK